MSALEEVLTGQLGEFEYKFYSFILYQILFLTEYHDSCFITLCRSTELCSHKFAYMCVFVFEFEI